MAICDNKQVSASFLLASPCCFVIMSGGGRAHKLCCSNAGAIMPCSVENGEGTHPPTHGASRDRLAKLRIPQTQKKRITKFEAVAMVAKKARNIYIFEHK